MKYNVLSRLVLGAAVPMVTGEAAEFIPLGHLPGGASSAAIDLSADGLTVLGESQSEKGLQTFRWSLETGFSLVPGFEAPAPFGPNLTATSLSGDGSTVAGVAFTGEIMEGVKWSAGDGFTTIGVLPGSSGQNEFSQAVDISGDGSVLAAVGTAPDTQYTAALLWTRSLGLIPLGYLPDDQPEIGFDSFSFTYAVSRDGQVVVGASASTKHIGRDEQAFRWTQGEGMQPLGFLTGEVQSAATAVSADGSAVAGYSGSNAFRWTAEKGMEPIGQFFPTGISADGSVIVGVVEIDWQPVAMIWTAASAAQPLQTYLQTKLNLPLPGWESLNEAVGISEDGLVVAGTGINAAGLTEAFIATLDPSVQTTGSITFSGAVSPFLLDPSGNRYGTSPEDGTFYNEIPDLTLGEEGAKKTATWTDFIAGDHMVYITGTEAGPYQLEFNFVHLNAEASGASFAGNLLKGGVHLYAAHVSTESAADAQYRLVFSDTDGDGLADGSDAVPRSDLRATVFIDGTNTGLPNRKLSDGSTLNDLINAEAAKATNHGEFVSAMAQMTKLWTSGGLLPKEAKALIQTAAAQASIP